MKTAQEVARIDEAMSFLNERAEVADLTPEEREEVRKINEMVRDELTHV